MERGSEKKAYVGQSLAAAQKDGGEGAVEDVHLGCLEARLDVQEDLDESATGGGGGGVDVTLFQKPIGAHTGRGRSVVAVRRDASLVGGAQMRWHASLSVALRAADTIALVLYRCKCDR